MAAGYGIIELGGRKYIEKYYQYTLSGLSIAANASQQPKIVLDGNGGFLLKSLMVVYSTASGGNDYFRCRLGNSDGSQWYSSAGVVSGSGGSDKVHSLLMFGNGQFPVPVNPYILFLPNGAIYLDIQNLTASTISPEFAFTGSKLYDYAD